MRAYRESRNLERSLLDQIQEALVKADWNNVRVEKVFALAYKGKLPSICVNIADNNISSVEIGDDEYFKDYTIEVRIFATDDGMRLDLADYLVEVFSHDLNYYQYEVNKSEVVLKKLKGKIRIKRPFNSNRKELILTDALELEDRYRHLLSFDCRVTLKGEGSCGR